MVGREENVFGYARPGWRDRQRGRLLSGTEDVELVVPTILLAKGWGRLGIVVADKTSVKKLADVSTAIALLT